MATELDDHIRITDKWLEDNAAAYYKADVRAVLKVFYAFVKTGVDHNAAAVLALATVFERHVS